MRFKSDYTGEIFGWDLMGMTVHICWQMVVGKTGEHDVQPEDQSFMSMASQWWSNSAAQIPFSQMQATVPSNQGGNGASGCERLNSPAWHGPWRRIPGGGHENRPGGPPPGLHGGRGTAVRK